MTTENATPAWRAKLTFLDPHAHPREIEGKTFNFYPISVKQAFRIRTMGKELAGAFAAIFADTRHDYSTVQREFAASEANEDTGGSELIVDAVSVEMAQLRTEQKQEAYMKIVDAITDEANSKIVGEIIMDSLRDEFPPGHVDNPPAAEFMEIITLPVLTELLLGVASANKGLFGPLVGKLNGVWSQVEKTVQDKLKVPTLGETSPEASGGSSNEDIQTPTSST